MNHITAEQLAQRIHDAGLMEHRELNQVFASAGGKSADREQLEKALLAGGHLTNWQLTRVLDGQRQGYFYGDWKVLYLVGHGTFARVYRGVNRETGEVRAIKVLRNRYCAEPDKVDEFIREAKTVMKLRHPNIVPISEVDTHRNRSYMVMDFVEGQNLRDFVKAHKGLEVMTALKLALDLASGLEYAGARGITHRDLKLSNVLLSSKGVARLVDFGLAAITSEGEGQTDAVARSIDYAGLEKLTGAPRNDPRSDIYFLGCMLYNMLAGEPPLFETRERMKRQSARRFREIKPLTSHIESLPHRVVVLVNRLMDLDPAKRVQNPAQAVREIKSVIKALEAGDTTRYDENLARQHEEDYEKLVNRQLEGDGRTVMLVESDAKLQNLFREKLKEIGYRVLVIGNPRRALERFDDLDSADPLPADCVMFGCKGLGSAGVEAFNEFAIGEFTAKVPAILLLTDGQEKLIDRKHLADHRIVFRAPLKMKRIRKALVALVQQNDASAAR